MTKQQVLLEARRLSREDQIDLASELWDGGADVGPAVTPELAAELERRVAAEKADPTPSEDWDVLRAKLLNGEI